MASGRRSKNAAPSRAPAAKQMKRMRYFSMFCFFILNVRMPTRETTLTKITAPRMYVSMVLREKKMLFKDCVVAVH